MKLSSTPTPSAEEHIEKTTKNDEVEHLKAQALLHFKMGLRNNSQFFIVEGQNSLKEAMALAKQQGKVIPLHEIDAIMDGKAPHPSAEDRKDEKKIIDTEKKHDAKTSPDFLHSSFERNTAKIIAEIKDKLREWERIASEEMAKTAA